MTSTVEFVCVHLRERLCHFVNKSYGLLTFSALLRFEITGELVLCLNIIFFLYKDLYLKFEPASVIHK